MLFSFISSCFTEHLSIATDYHTLKYMTGDYFSSSYFCPFEMLTFQEFNQTEGLSHLYQIVFFSIPGEPIWWSTGSSSSCDHIFGDLLAGLCGWNSPALVDLHTVRHNINWFHENLLYIYASESFGALVWQPNNVQ